MVVKLDNSLTGHKRVKRDERERETIRRESHRRTHTSICRETHGDEETATYKSLTRKTKRKMEPRIVKQKERMHWMHRREDFLYLSQPSGIYDTINQFHRPFIN